MAINDNLLKEEILQLINSQREGDYWDFKVEPHENNASLLHDIICLANSLHIGERYLIWGVTDPSVGCKVVGIPEKNRKSQIQIVDFLRTVQFAGIYRPEIELRSINIDDKEIDVLIIFDRPYKPYFLSEDYRDRGKCVRANYIYSRVNDGNTPIDKSTDYIMIEKMWRQKFGLDNTPLERMKLFLNKPDDWIKDVDNKRYAYCKYSPEYHIEFSEMEKFYEPYSFFYPNEVSYIGRALFKYHTTILFELEYMCCDERRITLAVPQYEYLVLKNVCNWYYYYELDSLQGFFLAFLTNSTFDFVSRGGAAPFICFKNSEERKKFNEYILAHQDVLEKCEVDITVKEAFKMMCQKGKNSVMDPIFAYKMWQVYGIWKLDNN